MGTEFTFDKLQRQLKQDGYGPQSMNTKEVGTALKLAGITQSRRAVGGAKKRLYRLPDWSPHDDPFKGFNDGE